MPTSGSYYGSPPIVPPSSQIPEQEKSAIATARDMLFSDESSEKWLTLLMQNWGVDRPEDSPFDDDLARRVFQAIACPGPKTTLSTLYFLMEAVFGSQASLVTQGKRPWRIYEIEPSVTEIEVPFDLLGTSNDVASYLHGWTGETVSGATSTVFSCYGDARVAAVSLVGLNVSVLVSGAYEERVILSATYDPTTDLTQITVTVAFSAPPGASAPFFISVPGDGVSSFRGDYVAPIWYATGNSTSVAANTLTDAGAAMTPNAYVGFFLRLADGDVYYPIDANSATAFTLGANGATPPPGFYAVVASPTDALEESDTPTTPPHADRVYVTGDGLLEVVKQYVAKVCKAASVVVIFDKVG